MKLFFIDDSYYRRERTLGQGGIVVDETELRSLQDGIRAIKLKHKIPLYVELKWSPGRDNYLRTRFKGDTDQLYKDAFDLLHNHNCVCLCALHLLGECHGYKAHGWTINTTKKWAIDNQITYLAERFQKMLVVDNNSFGIMIMDRMQEYGSEADVVRALEFELLHGTRFEKLSNITLNLLSADSKLCAPIQLADLVIGATVNWICGGKRSQRLFPEFFTRFLHDGYGEPHRMLSGLPSGVIIGYGLKLFPHALSWIGRNRFAEIDNNIIFRADSGFVEK